MRPKRSTMASRAAWHDSASVMSRRTARVSAPWASVTSAPTSSQRSTVRAPRATLGPVLGEEQGDVAPHARADARHQRDLPVDQSGDGAHDLTSFT